MTLIWELDFYSRPIVDDQGKRLWEVVICEAPTQVNSPMDQGFRFADYCPNTQVNSLWLQDALKRAMAAAGAQPTQIRFFRRQMNNMISKTCDDLGLPHVISRRTIVLDEWLKQRYAEVYPQHPGYEDKTPPSVQYPQEKPQVMPDPLQGEKWQVVTLAWSDLGEMSDWDISFGEAFPLELLGLDSKTPIPGVILYSARALPLAAWMSGLELGFLKLEDSPPPALTLETGSSDRWILANLPNEQRLDEIRSFEATKAQAQGVHFLAIQTSPDAQAFAGFWLLKELNIG